MSRRGIASVAALASIAAAAFAAPASAQTDNWAVAAAASSEYGGSIAIDDPTGQSPIGGLSGGTSECTSTLEGFLNTEPDDAAELALALAWFIAQGAGVPLPGDPPELPDADFPDVDLPQACTPGIGVNGVASGNWSAARATGPADTYPGCGDLATAWAPKSSGTDPETLTTLHGPVAGAQRVDIYETNIGGFVTEVVVHVADGPPVTVFSGPDTTGCPGILSIPLSGSPTVVGVEIHTQAAGWEEIDAVSVVN